MTRWTNWSGRVTARPANVERPTSESELGETVRAAAGRGDTVRVAGSGHSFSPVVPTDDTLISLDRYTGVVDIDAAAGRATVRAGTRLAALNRELDRHGLAMENLGDVDRQTVAGALSTGTHGTGLDFGVLSTQATRFRVVTATGDVVDIDESETDRFHSAQVSLGALGVVSTVTLELDPAYDLCLRRRALPLETVLENIETFHDAHRNWEFFWFPHTDTALVKTFDEVPRDADRQVGNGSDSPVDGLIAAGAAWLENASWEAICRLGTRFPSTATHGTRLAARSLSDKTEVGPSFEMFANPRRVRFHETEYSLPAGDLPAALRTVREYIETESVPVQFPIECRFVGGDDPYLSPAYGRDSGFIAVHTYHEKDLPGYFDACEAIFEEFDGRPHWGKAHSKTATELANLYPKWDTFRAVRAEFDPEGRFLNDHLETVLGTAGDSEAH